MKAAPSEKPDPSRRPRKSSRRAPEKQPGGFAVDAERVASLLDGRLGGAERDELLERLLASDDDFRAFAETAAVLRATEAEEADP